jgi:hypothetical protein
LLHNTCRKNHETAEPAPEIVCKTATLLRTDIDKYGTGVTTHRWMRKRCSKEFLEQGLSSQCLMASNTSNTITRRHIQVTACRPLKLYTSLAPPPPPRNLSAPPSSLSFLENITQCAKKKELLIHFPHSLSSEQGRREVDNSELGKWVIQGFRRDVKSDLRSSGMIRSADWLLLADVS